MPLNTDRGQRHFSFPMLLPWNWGKQPNPRLQFGIAIQVLGSGTVALTRGPRGGPVRHVPCERSLGWITRSEIGRPEPSYPIHGAAAMQTRTEARSRGRLCSRTDFPLTPRSPAPHVGRDSRWRSPFSDAVAGRRTAIVPDVAASSTSSGGEVQSCGDQCPTARATRPHRQQQGVATFEAGARRRP
jgi:hypothetical protein